MIGSTVHFVLIRDIFVTAITSMRSRSALALFAMLAMASCLPQRSLVPDPPTGPGLHVLFIGNSLTYVNDLPRIVEALADSGHQPLLETRMVAKPDYSLEDHWSDGDAMAAIRKGGWDFVVLQQGPSSVEQNRQLLIDYARRFADPIRAAGGRPALYAVWPTVDRRVDFERAGESYRLAAQAVDGVLFAVGSAWQATWKRDPSAPLYAFDGLHPSAEGSYLAALVIYATLYQQSPIGLPSRLRLRTGEEFGVSATMAATLQTGAADVVFPTVAPGMQRLLRETQSTSPSVVASRTRAFPALAQRPRPRRRWS
jgi:hypothetical protein